MQRGFIGVFSRFVLRFDLRLLNARRAIFSKQICRSWSVYRSRSETSGYSPFGIALCPPASGDNPTPSPFLGWEYTPIYIPKGFVIWMAHQDKYPWEPGIFYLDFCKPIESPANEPTKHGNGARRISKIAVTMKTHINELSEAANSLTCAGNIDLVTGVRPFVEFTLLAHKNEVLTLTQAPIKFIFKDI